ncbi:MAG: sigma-70 family RNA polymerase sigma factor [Planctomycetaceae bacterium]|jgi:RNA polymerase sigma-70 factor (ECF subfamily)|nr:sigma-70 family RNA polymerase sigma factor [Planctomycetaceae bacterium]
MMNMQDDTLYEAIRCYAARLLSDPDAAQDVVQEVFLRFEQNQEKIGQPRAWAYQTARNLVIDHFRRLGKTNERTENSYQNICQNVPAEATRFNPALLAEKKEEIKMIQKKVNDLPARHREVLRLKFQEGLKYAEIAEVLNEPVTTVAWLLHEAITLLRKELKVES